MAGIGVRQTSVSVKGFTLIELVSVIVILGILFAIVVPRFVDLSRAAKAANVQGLANRLGSASALNFAANILAREDRPVQPPVPVAGCSDAERLIEGEALPHGYYLEAEVGEPETVGTGETAECLVIDSDDSTIRATFVLHGISPP